MTTELALAFWFTELRLTLLDHIMNFSIVCPKSEHCWAIKLILALLDHKARISMS